MGERLDRIRQLRARVALSDEQGEYAFYSDTAIYASKMLAQLSFWAELFDRFEGEIEMAVDVGGNIGETVFGWAALLPKAKVYVIEPNPANAAAIRRNMANFDNVKVLELAASDRSGQLKLALPDAAQRDTATYTADIPSSLYSVWGKGKHGFEAQAERLDHILPRGVGMLKIDVEGYELEVLRGAERILTGDRPILMVELSERNQAFAGRITKEIVEHLAARGYLPIECMGQYNYVFAPRERIEVEDGNV